MKELIRRTYTHIHTYIMKRRFNIYFLLHGNRFIEENIYLVIIYF